MSKSRAHKIMEEIDALYVPINVLYCELRVYQDKCKHKRAKKKPKGDYGNWDKSQDRYWYECKCPTCLKEWTEDQ